MTRRKIVGREEQPRRQTADELPTSDVDGPETGAMPGEVEALRREVEALRARVEKIEELLNPAPPDPLEAAVHKLKGRAAQRAERAPRGA